MNIYMMAQDVDENTEDLEPMDPSIFFSVDEDEDLEEDDVDTDDDDEEFEEEEEF